MQLPHPPEKEHYLGEGLHCETSANMCFRPWKLGNECLGPEWSVGKLKVCCPALQKVQLAIALQISEQVPPSSPQLVTGILGTGTQGLKDI